MGTGEDAHRMVVKTLTFCGERRVVKTLTFCGERRVLNGSRSVRAIGEGAHLCVVNDVGETGRALRVWTGEDVHLLWRTTGSEDAHLLWRTTGIERIAICACDW